MEQNTEICDCQFYFVRCLSSIKLCDGAYVPDVHFGVCSTSASRPLWLIHLGPPAGQQRPNLLDCSFP